MYARILIDNITKNEWASEWGLSIYIEHNGHTILLDTGASGTFAANADAMGIDLRTVEFGVLSHAHYDHADGLETFFQRNAQAKFYIREAADENCYGKKLLFKKYIGIHRGYLSQFAGRIVRTGPHHILAPGIELLAHSTPNLARRGRKAGMYIRRDGHDCPDCFDHEQSLILDTEQGLVVCNSCSHAGVDTILQEVSQAYPERPVYAFIGGMHLCYSSEKEVRAAAGYLRDAGVAHIYTGHCTGSRAIYFLKDELKDCIEEFFTGMEIHL